MGRDRRRSSGDHGGVWGHILEPRIRVHPTLPAGLQSTPGGAPGPTSGNLGDTLTMVDAGEDVAHVTLVKVFDPATGVDPNTTPPDGTRWVGFEGTIVIDGWRAGEDSTSVDVIGSDGQTYGADTAYHLSVFDGCTATGIDVASGQTQTFCAGVGLPPGVTVAKVGYSTEGVDGNAPATLFWTVAGAAQNTGPNAYGNADARLHADTRFDADSGCHANAHAVCPMTALVERWTARIGAAVRHISRRAAEYTCPA